MTGGKSAGVVLAAGGSSRMGRPKQLLLVGGRPLLERVVAAVCGSRLDQVVVVLGANADAILAGVDTGCAAPLLNPDHATGMASSLRAGLNAVAPDVERAVIILGDQPAISASLIDELLDLQAASDRPAAALSFGRLLHPPVVLQRELWADLEALEGDVGCRALIRARPELVVPLPVSSDMHHPVDVDTPDDYARLVESGSLTG